MAETVQEGSVAVNNQTAAHELAEFWKIGIENMAESGHTLNPFLVKDSLRAAMLMIEGDSLPTDSMEEIVRNAADILSQDWKHATKFAKAYDQTKDMPPGIGVDSAFRLGGLSKTQVPSLAK